MVELLLSGKKDYLGLDAASWGSDALPGGAVGVVEVGRGRRGAGEDEGDGELGHLDD